MAGELQIDIAAQSGSTLYALLYNGSGQACIVGSATFENFVDANIGNYDIVMTEQGTASGFFRGDMPAVVAGVYSAAVRLQAGGAPAVSDTTLGTIPLFYWDGTQIVIVSTLSQTTINNIANTVVSNLLNISAIKTALRSVDLELYRGDTWIQGVSNMGDISTATEIWFSAKRDKDATDATADILISQTVGLEYIDQVPATVAGNGSITVTDAVNGDITVRLEAVETAKLDIGEGEWYWDVQWTDGTTVTTPRRGRLTMVGDVVRATS